MDNPLIEDAEWLEKIDEAVFDKAVATAQLELRKTSAATVEPTIEATVMPLSGLECVVYLPAALRERVVGMIKSLGGEVNDDPSPASTHMISESWTEAIGAHCERFPLLVVTSAQWIFKCHLSNSLIEEQPYELRPP